MKFPLILAVLMLAPAQAAPLAVSATTTVVADFVRVVGGQRVSLNIIVPTGSDAHTFQPSTAVIRGLAGSRALFVNGANLEPWLPKLTASAPGMKVVTLTRGLKLHEGAEEDEHAGEAEHGAVDPHAWWDAGLAAGYVRNVQSALTALDPAGKAVYANNAAAYL
ncbi:MAG: adhesin, partial [Deinococcus sp.]|nr:adhesin [Deinococcus sp.]